MSFAHMGAIFEYEAGAVTGSRLLLLLYLANCADKNGVCWPPKARILEATGFTDRTFRNSLSELVAIGAVSIHRVLGKGIKYTVALPTVKRQGLLKDSDCQKTACQKTETAKEQGLLKDSEGGCQKTVGGLPKDSGGAVKRQPKPINNLSINSQEPVNIFSHAKNESESVDSPKNLSDQKLNSEEKAVNEENLDIEEALAQIPFSDGDFINATRFDEVSEGTGSQEGGECAKSDLNAPQVDKPKKARKTKKTVSQVTKPEGVSPEVWEQWIGLKKAKSKYVSPLMVTAIEREAQKAGITTEEAMTCQIERGWTGFKAEWYSNDSHSQGTQQQRPRRKSRFDDVPNTDDFEAGLLGLN